MTTCENIYVYIGHVHVCKVLYNFHRYRAYLHQRAGRNFETGAKWESDVTYKLKDAYKTIQQCICFKLSQSHANIGFQSWMEWTFEQQEMLR